LLAIVACLLVLRIISPIAMGGRAGGGANLQINHPPLVFINDIIITLLGAGKG
jgi:hypothetical protein